MAPGRAGVKDLLRLLKLGHAARGMFALGALLALVVVLANIALLGLAGWFITAMAAAGLAGASMNYFTPSAGIRAFAILRTAGRYLERVVNHDATLKTLSHLRVWVYTRIEPLAPAVLARYRKGDVLARLVANVDALDNAWLRIFTPVIVAVCTGAALFGFLWIHSPAVAWVDVALLACIGAVLPFFAERLGRRPAARAAAVNGDMKASLTEDFAGLAELSVLGALPARGAAHGTRNRRLIDARHRGLSTEAATAGLTVAFTGIAVASTWRLAAPAAATGRASPLVLPLLLFVVLASTEGVQALPAAFRALGDTLAAARRVFSLADETPQVVERPHAIARVADHALAFAGVCFRHESAQRRALDDISFALPEGSAIAIVGASGAGKSTLAQLALRFYEPERGIVTLGGRTIATYTLDALRTQFAWADQSTRLFSTTIRENLRLALPNASDAALWRALEAAAFADEVRQFDQGLDHFVGAGGLALSAGQARRLALARAWLSPAPILLLDEATEGLDPVTARRIVTRFANQRGNRSLLWITHQALGLENMDEVIVMDGGRIADRGTHETLLAHHGFYRDMASRVMLAGARD